MTLVQKRLVGTAALLVVAGAGFGVVYWQDQRAAAVSAADKEDTSVIALRDATRVRELELATPHGTFALVREGGADGVQHWSLTAPEKTAAEDTTIDGMVEHFTRLARSGRVGFDKDGQRVGPPPEAKNFGLDPARFVVTLTTSDGQKASFAVGEKSSFDGSMYVQKRGSDEIWLVPGALEYQVDKDLFKLRDKRLAVYSVDEVKSFKVSTEGRLLYAVAKEGSNYKLTEPLAALGDSVQLSALLSSLTSVDAKAFVVERPTPADLKAYGFADPKVMRVELALERGVTTLLFAQVKAGSGRRYYAKVDGASPIVELSTDWATEKLLVAPAELRDKHTLAFEREALTKLEITRGDITLAFTKGDKPEGGETWQMTAPEQAKAQDAKVASLVYRLWNLKAKRIVAEKPKPEDLATAGLDKPALQVKLYGKDGASLGVVSFGKAAGEEQFVTSGTRIDAVDKTVADDTSTSVADYKEVPTAKAE